MSGSSSWSDNSLWPVQTCTGMGEKHFISHVAEWRESGANLIGGCCRTTPITIKAISKVLHDQALHTSSPSQVPTLQKSEKSCSDQTLRLNFVPLSPSPELHWRLDIISTFDSAEWHELVWQLFWWTWVMFSSARSFLNWEAVISVEKEWLLLKRIGPKLSFSRCFEESISQLSIWFLRFGM
jgi:hypothetical protein